MERSQPIEYADLMSSGDKEQVRLEPRSTTASGGKTDIEKLHQRDTSRFRHSFEFCNLRLDTAGTVGIRRIM
jgi:hypothetical protein